MMMKVYAKAFRAMGCQVNVWLETDKDGNELLQQVPGWIEPVEARLSRFRPESELIHLNQHLQEWVYVSDVMLANLESARLAAHLTGGLCTPLVAEAVVAAGYDRSFEYVLACRTGGISFSEEIPSWRNIRIERKENRVWIPAPLDLGGTAKGWTARLVARRLRDHGNCLVDIGGDMVAYGHKQWMIDVAQPQTDDRILGTVKMSNGAIVTSGIDFHNWFKDGQIQHHIINPNTGQPAQTDVVSVTIVHSDVILAEASAKAVLIMGSKAGIPWLAKHGHTAGMIVCQDGSIHSTASFARFVVVE